MSGTLYHLQRRVIFISGPDACHLLQGLITQDIEKLSPQSALYSLLLTPQGKFLYDFFLFESPSYGEGFFIDCGQQEGDFFLKTLQLYRLRAQVTWEICEDFHVYGLVRKNESDILPAPLAQCSMAVFLDPRYPLLGWRIYVTGKTIKECPEFLKAEDFESAYTRHLVCHGIPESGRGLIPSKSIPLECGLQDLGAISWEKGCYLGQEPTARARYRGVIRKRLFPGSVQQQGGYKVQEGDLVYEKDSLLAKVVCVDDDRILAMVRLENRPFDFLTRGFPLYARVEPSLEEDSSLRDRDTKGYSKGEQIGEVLFSQPSWMNIDQSKS